jgi:hypothetical protein
VTSNREVVRTTGCAIRKLCRSVRVGVTATIANVSALAVAFSPPDGWVRSGGSFVRFGRAGAPSVVRPDPPKRTSCPPGHQGFLTRDEAVKRR